jgi:predicted XRE-type DNA-binding protein
MTISWEDNMDTAKRKKLEKAGWKVGSSADFLGMTPEEAAYVDMKLALSQALRQRREGQGLTQTELAKVLGSSQSRVAKMEAGEASVSVDLLVRGLLAAGATSKEIARVISAPQAKSAA